MKSCTDEHSPATPCECWNCFVLSTELFGKTILAAYATLWKEGYTVVIHPKKTAIAGVCPMLMAQEISSTYKLDVSEAQIVMNLPPTLAYANSGAGEGCIFPIENF